MIRCELKTAADLKAAVAAPGPCPEDATPAWPVRY